MSFSDSFTGSVGAKVLLRSGWTKLGSGYDPFGPEIGAANQVRSYSDVSDVAMIGQDIAATDHYVQANVYAGFAYNSNTGTFPTRLAVRSVDRNTFVSVCYDSFTNLWEIRDTFGRQATYAAALGAGDLCRIEAIGTAVNVYINGTLRMTSTDSTANTAVGMQIRGTPSSDPVLDNWQSGTITTSTAPSAPTIGTATAGNGQATVSFTVNSDGGSAITSTTVISTPGSHTGVYSGATSGSAVVTGLTNGTAYTFTAHSTNAVGSSSESSASNSVTPAALTTSITLVDSTDTVVTGLSSLKWAWFDQVSPGSFAAPTDSGTTGTTNGSGILTVTLTNTTKTSGQVGWLIVTNSDGTTTQSPAHKCFSGPVAVN